MSGFVAGRHRRQRILLPETLDDYVSEENPVRFIDAFVDGLDLTRRGFLHAEPNANGRPPYHPGDLLKLYLYGYLNAVRSSRKLERECHRNLEVLWLMRTLAPDFKTIADFRAKNADSIRPVFRELVALCGKLGLLDRGLVAIDGSKFRACNSLDRHLTPEVLGARLKAVDEHVGRYLRELDANDARESGEEPVPYPGKTLREKVAALREKRRSLLELRSRMAAAGLSEVSLTDPDSRVMKSRGRLEMGYNAQIAVEAKHKIIVEYDVDNRPSDVHQLAPMATRCREILGADRLKVTADRGYYDGEQARRCAAAGITPYVPRPERAEASAERLGISPEFHRDRFRYDPATDTVRCPAGHRMTPSAPFQVRRRGRPEGTTAKVYRTTACGACPHRMTRCTMDPRGRSILRAEHADALEAMDARMRTAEGRRIRDLRKALVEHPFGTMKRGFHQGTLLLKGLRKVRGEIGLTMLAYDLRRALTIVGTAGLVASLRS